MKTVTFSLKIADFLTLSRLFLTPVLMLFIIKDMYLWAGVVVALVILTDFFDGYVARKLKEVTKHGELLDPAVDKIFTISTLAAFVEKQYISSFVIFLIVARELIITWLRSVMANNGFVMSASFLGKLKTTLQLIGIFFLAIHQILIGNAIIWLSILVAYISAVDYFKALGKG